MNQPDFKVSPVTDGHDPSRSAKIPVLSIIIPTFNASRTIIRCLESIEKQIFKSYEVIIQDGNSTDQTIDLVSDFHRSHPDCNIRQYRESDRGVYDAMNKAMQHAIGSWLYFLGSDDELYSNFSLREMLEDCRPDHIGVLYGNVQMVAADSSSGNGVIYDGPFTLEKLLTKNICHQSMFYRRALVEQVGFYDLRYKTWSDWDYNLRCWKSTLFDYTNTIVARYYPGGLSSHGQDQCFLADAASKAMDHFGLSALHPILNNPTFIGLAALEAIQCRRFPGYHTFAKILRKLRRSKRIA